MLYEERLREFFQGMVFKLHRNAHKRTPDTTDVPDMALMLLMELEEFRDQFIEDKTHANCVVELFDVSNFAFLMFVALRNQGTADWQNTPEEDKS